MRVLAATGRQTENPYRIARIERNIYSVEELCYSLVQSAQFLGTEIMDPALVRWIDKECELPELARQLQTYLGKERALSDYVNAILNYVGYITADKRARTKQIVESGLGMEPFEKRAAKARFLAISGQSYEALGIYETLLQDLPGPEREMRANILCRMGGIYADLFRFRTAAEHYGRAYDLTGDNETYVRYLAAVRFGLSDSEYLSFIAEHPEAHGASIELEERINDAGADYAHSESRMIIDRLKRYKEEGQETNYEIALHSAMQRMKDDYRRTKESKY